MLRIIEFFWDSVTNSQRVGDNTGYERRLKSLGPFSDTFRPERRDGYKGFASRRRNLRVDGVLQKRHCCPVSETGSINVRGRAVEVVQVSQSEGFK